MGGSESPECQPSTEEEEEEEEVAPRLLWAAEESLSGIRLTEAPILLLVYFHKAFRAELAELCRGAAALAEMGPHGRRERLRGLRGRFEFLMLAHEYPSAAEDEVIFPALDSHVKNVVCTYSLEHRSIGELFNSTIRFFDLLMEDDDNEPEPYQELVFSLSTVQSSVCKHMRKEEKQVFWLLMQRFSRKEQASLVWQFLCGVPVMLLENLLPWMISFVSPDEQDQINDFVKETVPEETLLQEVMIGWLRKKDWSYLTGNVEIRSMCELYGRSASGESTLEQQQPRAKSVGKIPKFSLTNGFKIWHGAIRRDFETALEALHLLKSSGTFSNLPAVLLQLKFLLDVLVLYSNALCQIYYPELNELADGREFSSFDWFAYESQIGRLQQLLRIDAQDEMFRCDLIEQLSRELKSFQMEINRFFSYQEIEVLNVISMNCSHEMQMQLLYTSICTLPLGWIECVITWFSARLSAEESRSILVNINRGDNKVGSSFTLLLHEWFRITCSGKKSIGESRTDARYLFKTTLFTLPEHFKGEAEFSASTSQADNKSCRGSYPRLLGTDSAAVIKLNTSHSGRIALSSFFSLRPKASNNSKFSAVNNDVISNMDRWEPVDIILFFHKVMEKDLTNLVQKSLKLMEDAGFLEDFQKRFVLICSLYQIHSDTEDEVAFPAFEEKGKVQNMSFSYTIDHRLEAQHISDISSVLDKISKLHISSNDSDLSARQRHHHLCLKLQDMCRSMHRIVSDHIRNEEIEIWASVRASFSVAEQEKIIGCMLGRIRAEVLQDMIPWLMESLTPEERQTLMSTWRHVTRNTMFDEWMREWWEGDSVKKEVELNVSSKDILEERGEKIRNQVVNLPQGRATISKSKQLKMSSADKGKLYRHKSDVEYSKCTELSNGAAEHLQVSHKSEDQENVSAMSQEELEAAIRRVSRDSSLDLHKKSSIIQSLLMSRWITAHQKSNLALSVSSDGEDIPGRSPSYRDQLKMTYGCKHYKRNCKLLAPCCDQLYSCRRCHDEENYHSVDRKSITKMMCMKCLTIQPIGTTCSTASCDNLLMAKYYCRICNIYDDERQIYHCPYCNLCRVGKGLGIEYFHCMNCNACMSRSLAVHKCRQKCLEENCPICHEYIFTSNSPVKALPCGHLMHSACFREYTCTHYTCPICSKSLGNMQGYFQMLDTLLAEEQMPDEYSGKTQNILTGYSLQRLREERKRIFSLVVSQVRTLRFI
ncbi:zinc finger protein BRUTUS-like At1g74770 isoform X2 [Rhodamnia argentea]|uniref:Zinc finger protein BRUTUS-like At1g74770 isoform X2 n=1 Tax=Rhodamnia argentea TaxID=178133 RepID=A0ABM3HKZ7_9MYRT|nr:zinc finger protein BRUTUS-like At1g74770 isoform X2 [Rhodamnia argentea]